LVFLFPGIFVYDNNIGGAAGHYLALFVAPSEYVALSDSLPKNAVVMVHYLHGHAVRAPDGFRVLLR
jgi:hypothetical protein